MLQTNQLRYMYILRHSKIWKTVSESNLTTKAMRI